MAMFNQKKRNGENYIFLGGEFDVKSDEWDGTWAVIDVPATGEAAESPIEVITIDSPFNNAGGITEETEPDTPFAPQQWESVSTLDTEITQGGAVTSIDTPLISNDFSINNTGVCDHPWIKVDRHPSNNSQRSNC